MRGALLILVNEKGEVLLQHKDAGAPTYSNQWCLFGGGIEDGETAQQAIHREFVEELEWDLADCKPIASYPDNEILWGQTTKTAEELGSRLHEGDDLGYFSESQIMSMDVAKPHLQALKDYFKKGKA